jgi:predicted Zn-dependent protease with MMP-like domain
MLSHWPAGRRVAFTTALCLAVALTIAALVQGLAASGPLRLLEMAAVVVTGALVIGGAIGLAVAKLADYHDPESEEDFERLVLRSEELAREHLLEEPDFGALDPYDPHDFELLVRDALDDLPDLLIRALDHVAVVISDQGRKHRAYGLYQTHPPDTVAREKPGLIVIFRDTLLRDFGHDPDRLRDQVTRTVRHELAHHLGADELGVRELGL